MGRSNNRLYLVLGILPPCALGFFTGWVHRYQICHILDITRRPPFTLPIFLIFVIWVALYVVFGFATSLILSSRAYNDDKMKALACGACQVVLNSLFVYVFFGLRFWGLAFLIQLFFVAASVVNALLYYQLDKNAGILMIPYVAFGVYMSYLTVVTIFFN